MGLVITILLYASLRRVSDVGIVLVALGGAMIWMQGLIGTFASITEAMGFSIIARSQFSNLLPILVLALGIDDSLHALHRYKEERILENTRAKLSNYPKICRQSHSVDLSYDYCRFQCKSV